MKKWIVAALMLSTLPASATELKLDDNMIQKLGPLCQSAIYGSRMIAEPICVEIGRLLAEAQKGEPQHKLIVPKDETKP